MANTRRGAQAVSNLVREEEALMAAHEKSVEKARMWLKLEEGMLSNANRCACGCPRRTFPAVRHSLLSVRCAVRSPEHDVDEFTDKLEAILDDKITLLTKLQRRLQRFKENLRREEVVSKQASAGGVTYY